MHKDREKGQRQKPIWGWFSSYWSEGSRNHLTFKIMVSNFIPSRGFAADLEFRGKATLQTPCHRASKPLGMRFETTLLKVRWFLDPSDQYELYHSLYIPKYVI